MATDTERLVLQLSADLRAFEKEMVRAAGTADRAAQRIERRFQQQNRRVVQDFQSFGNQARAVLATIGVGLIARDVVQLGDAWTRVGNALSVAGVEAGQLASVQATIADIAVATNSDLEATADLFSRMFRSSEDLGLSLQRVASITETVSKALAGASQAERASAIRQFGQGLGSGRFQGDELRSVLENAPVIARAIAEEFGVAVGQLRELGKTGELEAARVIRAIEAAAPAIEEAFARTSRTVGDAFTNLRTRAAQFIGTTEETRDATRSLANLIQFVANNFEAFGNAIILTAAVLGGTFAGVAAVKAIAALGSLVRTAGAARLSMAALGGIVGLVVTALALAADHFDLFTSEAAAATRASDSLYAALTLIQSLEVVESTAALADVTERATGALDNMTTSSQAATGQLGLQDRVTRGLAEAERIRTVNTLAQAVADQRAAIAAAQRGQILRDLARLVGQRPGTLEDFAAADARADAAIAQARESIALIQEAANALASGQVRIAGQMASGVRREATLTADELERAAKALEALGDRALSDLDAAVALEGDRERRDLEIELQLARARGDEEAIRNLERRLEIEQRIAELRRLGIEGDGARSKAEAELAALEAADMQGHFRDWFRGGIMAALEGDLGDFFENWLRERAAAGLEDALNQVADLVFQLFSSAFSQSGGKSGSSGNIWADLAAAVFGSFGGGKAGGGPVNAGRTYMVGERGPELFRPNQPGVVIPNGALGAGMTVNVVDARTINFKGTSEELRQLEAVVAADRRTRYSETVSIVSESLGRRQWGRR